MAYRFMQKNKGRYAIQEMAGLLGLSRGAYYQWLTRGVSRKRKENDAELLRLIREIVIRHKRRYGSPRVLRELRDKYGKRVSLKKVAQLMRENGLNARRRRNYIPTTDSTHSLPVCENILNQEFSAGNPGEKWVSDITYVRTTGGFIYLTVVLDLFDRKVVGWALSSCMDAESTSISAFKMAVRNRRPKDGLLFHSDRGVRYCAQSFRDALRGHCPSAIQSMSRKGNCWDNACAESFFSTLKKEVEELNGKHSAAQVRQAVFMFIETYYNRVRGHSTLDYVAPNVYNLRKVA